MKIKILDFQSVEYNEALVLRHQILRAPLGLEFKPEELANEGHDIHVGAFFQNKLVGCLLLSPLSKTVFKMRQVAVADSWRGSGVGSDLVQFAENLVQKIGGTEIILNARERAIPFYLRLGYEKMGDLFDEVTIPHQKMTKNVSKVQS